MLPLNTPAAAGYDTIIVGAGTSGSCVARQLTKAGQKVLLLEAGRFWTRDTYPKKQVDSGSQLYWSGGVELNHSADIAMLRPKCVGGGSIVNQALMDRFYDDAFPDWKAESGVEWFTDEDMAPWYDEAESLLHLETIPWEHRNRNADIFKEGHEKLGYKFRHLRRGQRDCRYEDGNDCIECLGGCRIDSKQSMPVTVLNEALDNGLVLLPDFEARRIHESEDGVQVIGRDRDGVVQKFEAARLVLASGAIGNSALLLRSGYGERLPVGEKFFCHPQRMIFAEYEEPVNSHKGAFQALASDDIRFRRDGYKLENVFAPPADVAMLVPGFGKGHRDWMTRYTHLACIEVAVRDTVPGTITITESGDPKIRKPLTGEDVQRLKRGTTVVRQIFETTGALRIVEGDPNIGLHLMGGCRMGTDPTTSVVGPDHRLHGSARIYAADSSIFPTAPGVNPALTIMAIALRAGAAIAEASA